MVSSSKGRFVVPLIVALLIFFSTLAVFRPSTDHYPYMVIEAPENISIIFLLNRSERAADCEATIANLASAILANCPLCRIKQLQCASELDSVQKRLLSNEPIDYPASRLPKGMAIYTGGNQTAALATCEESQRISIKSSAPTTCFPANTTRTAAQTAQKISGGQALLGALALIISCLAAWFAGWLIIRYEYLHGHLSRDEVAPGPQKFHAVPTPRIGGIGLVAGLLAGGAVLLALQPQFRFNTADFGYLVLAGAPAFLGGIAEDVTKKVGVLHRLLMTMLAGSMGAWLLGAILSRLNIPGIDNAFLWLPFAIAFTIFAVGGVANSINIIDGYNGLAGGFAVIVLAAMAWVAVQVGDGFVFTTSLILIGALFGFLIWNYPYGKIFLGDGGAYLLGFCLAELSVLLVVRNPDVSPWFPLLLLAYPVFETLFSIYRKKIVRGHSPGHPDGLHLHMLIYKRLIRTSIGNKTPAEFTRRNSLVAARIWTMTLISIVPALYFWRDTAWLLVFSLAFCGWYIWLYRRIVRLNAPTWLIKT